MLEVGWQLLTRCAARALDFDMRLVPASALGVQPMPWLTRYVVQLLPSWAGHCLLTCGNKLYCQDLLRGLHSTIQAMSLMRPCSRVGPRRVRWLPVLDMSFLDYPAVVLQLAMPRPRLLPDYPSLEWKSTNLEGRALPLRRLRWFTVLLGSPATSRAQRIARASVLGDWHRHQHTGCLAARLRSWRKSG